jgi:hypothetical protein
MRFWKRKPRHIHEWRTVGYGGTGWTLIRCATCGNEEIATDPPAERWDAPTPNPLPSPGSDSIRRPRSDRRTTR